MKLQIAILVFVLFFGCQREHGRESKTAIPQSVKESVGYDANRFTMYGNCICANDGMPLDNRVVTYGGDNYKNVTVVKWSGGRQEGKTTTTSSGAYRLQNVLPRGFHIKFTVTSTHYHQHGTGASASLKKCTYSHTEYLNDVGERIDIVARDFALKPIMESYPL